MVQFDFVEICEARSHFRCCGWATLREFEKNYTTANKIFSVIKFQSEVFYIIVSEGFSPVMSSSIYQLVIEIASHVLSR